jgi:hypothetical protein
MIEDSPNIPRMTTAMEDEQALLIRNLEDIGVVVYNRGVNSERNTPKLVEHLRNTINGNGRPLIVLLNGIPLNEQYYNNTHIFVRVGRNLHNHGEVVEFLTAIITCHGI